METKKRVGLKITAIVLVIVSAIYILIATLPKFDNYDGVNPMLVKEGDLPVLIAHGGGNKEFPDNTLEAFYNAYSVDQNVMMETDVSITKDGVVILSHDVTIDRKTNKTGKIIDWNYSDLISQQVDFSYTNATDENEQLIAGSPLVKFTTDDGVAVKPTDVPGYPDGIAGRSKDVFLATTLEDLLVHFPNNQINVEIKQDGDTGLKALNEVLRLLDEYDAYDRVVLASFHDEIFDEYQRLIKKDKVPAEFMCSPSVAGVVKFVLLHFTNLDLFYFDDVAVFQLPMEEVGINLATRSLVQKAHRHNIAVQYWTINDVDDMKHLISIGADGIMTDYPHRLKEVLDEYK